MPESTAPHRLVFVHAPQIYYEQNSGARFVPLWAYTLAAYVPASWTVSVCDCTAMDRADIAEAAVYAFSGINQDFHSIKSTHDYLKAKYPRATFILGGPITWSYEQAGKLDELRYFDYLFILDGERTFPEFLNRFAADRASLTSVGQVIRSARVPFHEARKMRFDLLEGHRADYYGGVVEVSRGCPFLCEFCDIRVLPENNETHPKDIDLIVQEIEGYYNAGVRQIQLACDNFIGDLAWAKRCTEAILQWVEKTGAKVALYTWTTVNIAKRPDLMTLMRKAGFTAVFIGVESFNSNSILETAKVQNKNDHQQMSAALREIQSFGFAVVPGLIFGFDSDLPSLFDDTLTGVVESGLIGGDPTFLIALPGTPLFARMQRTGRLIEDTDSARGLELHKERVSKIESNIRFLQPSTFLIRGYIQFIKRFTAPDYAYERFRRHVEIMMEGEHFVSVHATGYASVPEYLRFQFASVNNAKMLAKRLAHLLRPSNLLAVLKAYRLVLKHHSRYAGLKNHFSMWLFAWSNLLLKYDGLKEEHFRIHSVDASYDMNTMWKELTRTEEGLLPSGLNREGINVAAQSRSTHRALQRLKDNLDSSYSLSDFT